MKKKNNNFWIFGGIFTVVLILVLVFLPKNSTQLSGKDFLNKFSQTQNSVLLDVRTPAEFAAGHINGATNIDFENQTFKTEIGKLDKTVNYFVYCRSGNRSGQAVSIMRELGYKNIYELQGGIISNKDTINLIPSIQ